MGFQTAAAGPSELPLLFLDGVDVVVNAVECGPNRLEQLFGVVCGLGQLTKMMFEIVHALAAPGERRVRRAHDLDLVLQIGEKTLLTLESAAQFECLAEQRSDQDVQVERRRRFVGR